MPKVLAASTNSSQVDWNVEKEKAIKTGYTEQKIEAFKLIPDLPDEEDVSKFYDELPSETQNKTVKSVSLQERVVQEAKKQLGKPYGYANPPQEFTCDRLVKWAYKQGANIDLPGITTNQEKCGTEVSLSKLQIGDLLFWGSRGASYHVAIYIGNNQYIDAPVPGKNVRIQSIPNWAPQFARRILSTLPKKTPNTNGQKSGEQFIFRLYNLNAGQHHYTGGGYEATSVQNTGWTYEGVAWSSPTKGKNVYRLFNPKAKGNEESHHYTLNTYECNNLIKNGWKNDGTVWYALRALNK